MSRNTKTFVFDFHITPSPVTILNIFFYKYYFQTHFNSILTSSRENERERERESGINVFVRKINNCDLYIIHDKIREGVYGK